MYYYAEGALEKISPTQEFTNFKKREFVLKTEGKYPESIKFEFRNELVDALDNFMEGEMVTVAFVLRGNFFNQRHFVNLEAAAISEIVEGKLESEFEITKTKIKVEDADANPAVELVDDLPF